VTKTLLVDGNNLLKIGFYGVKEFYHKGEHVGGIWHFINTIKKFVEESNIDKVVVFWDGEGSNSARRLIYPQYKEQRRSESNEFKEDSFYRQKNRVKQYLEEMFVRQIDVNNNEADDLIAYYCHISEDEKKIIFSSDRDLVQLISEHVSIYSPNTKKTYKKGDKIKIYYYDFPHENIKTYKIISGDKSDNINGIYNLGEKTLVKLFPEILEKKIGISDILEKAEELLKTDKNNTALKNLLTGKTKTGIYGNEFFEINEKIVDLSNPLINEEGKTLVEQYYRESLDPDGRGYKNLMKLMMEDGFFKFLPKTDDAWVNFIKPFMKLTRKEKKNYNENKKN
jgi:5'-3' exonuclease